MCGRYTLTVTWEELLIYYSLEESPLPFHQPRYNVAPSQVMPALIHDGQKRRIGPLRWGLIPSWAKDEKIAYRTINARAETLLDKPAFRQSFQHKRCIIPADSFYEWKLIDKKNKQPMRIVPRQGRLFHMAGLYDTWVHPVDGAKISTFTIITTTPNKKMETIHDRMPVLLPAEHIDTWLKRDNSDVRQLQALLKPAPDEWLDMYPVSSEVGRVHHDSPACIAAIDDPPVLF